MDIFPCSGNYGQLHEAASGSRGDSLEHNPGLTEQPFSRRLKYFGARFPLLSGNQHPTVEGLLTTLQRSNVQCDRKRLHTHYAATEDLTMPVLFVYGSSKRTTIVSYSMALSADCLPEGPIPRLEDQQ